MDEKAKIEQLERISFAFEVNLTLDEIEWTRILGPHGLGYTLLQQMVVIGGDFFQIGEPEYTHTTRADVLCFDIAGASCQIRLEYEQPFTANLLSAVRQEVDAVNRTLRRERVNYRFVVARDECTGPGCTYRLMLVPTSWLTRAAEVFNVVAGMSLEDYELQPPYQRPDLGADFWEAR